MNQPNQPATTEDVVTHFDTVQADASPKVVSPDEGLHSSEQSRLAKWADLLLSVGGILALVLPTVVFIGSLLLLRPTEYLPWVPDELITKVNNLETAVDEMTEKLNVLDAKVSAMATIPKGSDKDTAVAAIRAGLAKEKKRLDKIEAGLMDNPTKALSVTLLRRDFENLGIAYEKDAEKLERDVDRLYDQGKWLIGTTALGMIMLAFTTLLKGFLGKDESKASSVE